MGRAILRAVVLAALQIFITAAHAQQTSETINEALSRITEASSGKETRIAPMAVKGDSTPGEWRTISGGIFDEILKQTGIDPCNSEPKDMKGRPGFLEYVGSSEVLNRSATRSTFGWFVQVKRVENEFTFSVDYFVLMSYDKKHFPRLLRGHGFAGAEAKNVISLARDICAFEVFVFGPIARPCTITSNQPDPPTLVAGLAVAGDRKLLSSVPLELAHAHNFDKEAAADKPVEPGVESKGHGCLECHDRDDQFPQSTLPFPWVKKQAAAASVPPVFPGELKSSNGPAAAKEGQSGNGGQKAASPSKAGTDDQSCAPRASRPGFLKRLLGHISIGIGSGGHDDSGHSSAHDKGSHEDKPRDH